MINTVFDIDKIKAEAEKLIQNFSQLNATFAKLPKEERSKISNHEQKINEAINNFRNEFDITE